MPTYIPDGYNLEAVISAAPESKSGERLWESMSFEYRPATRLEMVKLDAQVRIASKDEFSNPDAAEKVDKLISGFIANHVVSWDVKAADGIILPCTPATLGRIHDAVYQKMYFIIRGLETSDPRPDGTKPETDAEQLKN